MKQKLAQLLVLLTAVLLFAGGLVTSTDSGLAVPDWPLSYGSLTPPMVGGIRFEHTHRLIASTVGLVTLVLTLWIGFTEKRRAPRRVSIACLGAVVVQGILGGMTVLYKLPAPVSIFHACLGPSFFALTLVLTELLKEETEDPEAVEGNPAGFMAPAAVAGILLQIFLGAVVRHTSKGIWLHVIWAFGLFILLGFWVRRILADFPDNPRLARPAMTAGVLVTLQFFLGMGSFILTTTAGPVSGWMPVLFPTFHQTLGAVLLGISVLVAYRLHKYVRIVGTARA